MANHPTKTFGLRGPSDLLRKLSFDIRRLEHAEYSDEARFAAFDCALASWHLVDWILNSVDDDGHLRLCGKLRGVTRGFIEAQRSNLPLLEHCQQIANTGKHLVLTLIKDDPLLHAKSSVRFHPPFDLSRPGSWGDSVARGVAVVEYAGEQHDASDFFRTVERDWSVLLEREGLIEAEEPEPGNIFS